MNKKQNIYKPTNQYNTYKRMSQTTVHGHNLTVTKKLYLENDAEY